MIKKALTIILLLVMAISLIPDKLQAQHIIQLEKEEPVSSSVLDTDFMTDAFTRKDPSTEIMAFDFGGAGTQENPYIITKASDLNDISSAVQAGNDFAGVYFKSVASVGTINLGNFIPIGSNTKPFRGHFDGDGVNFNVTISRVSDYTGLFGYLDKGSIRNLSVSGSVTGGTNFTGGILGYLYTGTIENVYNLATINGVNYVGGISGYMYYGSIQKSFNNGSVTASGSHAGGITGYTHGNGGSTLIKNVYNRGEIIATTNAGGLVGSVYHYYSSDRYNTISDAYSAGLVSANTNAGGVIGSFTASANTRTRIYYDMSVIAFYDQPKTRKPEFVTDAYGVKSDSLILSTGIITGFDNTIWQSKAISGDTAYYPELKVFSSSTSSFVRSSSLQSVQKDISYGTGTSLYPFLIKNAFDMTELSRRVNKGNIYTDYYFKVDENISEIMLPSFTPIGNSTYPFQGIFDGNGVNFNLSVNNPSLDYQGLFGFMSYKTSEIKNLSVSGSVNGRNHVGSILGYIQGGTVNNVYNTASVHGTSHIGGIVGYVAGTEGYATITNTYNRGEITGTTYVGGIVGSVYHYYSSDRYSTISYSYSAGKVSASSGTGAGGVIGSYTASANTRLHLYYDITVIVNYDKPANTKPSTDPVTANNIFGITTGQFISDYMENRLTSGYVFTDKDDTYGYYPQLPLFTDHPLSTVNTRSTNSVKVEVGDGLGTLDMPFLIRTNQDLEDLKAMINAGNTYLGFYFKVDDGITSFDLGNFTPIGTNTKPFYGSFDGNNAVFNLAINRSVDFTGLFGYFGQGKISNLSVTGSVVGGTNHTGGIVGYQHSGTIENVYNLATITGTNYVGGIVGYVLMGDVKVAYNDAKVVASGSHAGGIAGYIHGSSGAVVITNTYNSGEILATTYAGGLVGYVYHNSSSDRISTISYSYSSGLVSANTGAGGVIGYFLPSANTRTHIYYDMSVIALYDQPRTLKPAFVSDAYGVKTEGMLFTSGIIKNFNQSVWMMKETSGLTGYYPALSVFANHEDNRIKTESTTSTVKDFSYGMGTLNYPFLIKNAFDMTELSRRVNKGNLYENYYFKVDEGLDEILLPGFTAIGNGTYPFQGIFDGNGVNFDVSINQPTLDNQGLFGFMSLQSSQLKNFSVSGTINGRNQVGSVLGYLQGGTVTNIYNQARVNGASNVGGIVGYVAGTVGLAVVTTTYNMGEITASSSVGGIVGGVYNYYPSDRFSTISYSYSAGQVAGSSGTAVGGVIGSYVGSANAREHLYYDITKIVNYDKPANTKPSTDPVTANNIFGITSGQFISDYLKTRLGENFTFVEISDGYGYYPQLTSFNTHGVEEIVTRSISSVEMFIGDGLGTSDIPFLIRTNEDLEVMKQKINAGNTFLGFHFKVDDGIDSFELGNFVPIGSDTKPFYGSFDGNHATFNLAINRTGNFTGLFGYFGRGTIKNLSVTGSVVGGNSHTGSVVGYQHSGIIQNVYNLADITGTNYVGGIVGYILAGTVRESYNHAKVVATASHAGGIAGYINGNGSSILITNTYNRGEIIATSYAGGLVGYVYHYYSSDKYSTISYSYSSGLVSANTGAGGVIGYYLASAHTRTHIYYDMSVIALYDQPKTLKPNYITDVYGLDTGILITRTSPISLFSDIYWSFITKTEDTGYYPALKVFQEHTNERISTSSMESITMDIAGGMGTATFPFLIKSEADMFELSRKVAAGNLYTNYYFKIDDGIDELILVDFTPIGNTTYPFEGIFDGNGANIDLTINKPTLDYQGLFGYIRNTKAEVKNFSMSGSVNGRNQVGAVAGYIQNGTIKNIYTTARVNGASNVGGIVGYISGSNGAAVVTNTYNRGEITASSNVGGIVGYVYHYYSSDRLSTVSYSYSAGQVAGSSGTGVGGVIGSYAASANTRTNLYYDVTEIVNYDKPANTKPLTHNVTANNIFGLTSGEFISEAMSSKLITGWTLTEKTEDHGYYPQLTLFAEHDLELVKERSLESVKIFIGGGLGTEDLPFLIKTVADLDELRSKIDAGNTFLGFYFKVDDSVDSFVLGNYSPIGSDTKPFYGSFDGNEAVFELAISRTGNFTGLFGYFGYGTIKNLSVTGTITGGSSHTGGIVGYQHSGNIENVYNLANVTGTNYVGGIVGYTLSGNVRESFNNGKVIATGSHAGGIVGYISGSSGRVVVTNTYNRGEVIATSYAGGLVGYVYHYYSSDKLSTVSYSYSAGLVSANTGAGGTIGYYLASANTRTHIYYDATILMSYKQPKTLKPSTVLGGMALSKTDMIDRRLSDFGFSESVWTFRGIEGNYAYYPQISHFAKSEVERISNQSVLSVRTNPFLGDGTASSPFLIRTVQDMVNLSKSITVDFDAYDVYYLVDQSSYYFNLIGTEFQPIGFEEVPFRGHFDGNYATFDLDLDGTDFVGLFGHIGEGSNIKNLAVSGIVKGENKVGSIAGYSRGLMTDVYSTAIVSGINNVGGLVGHLKGSLIYAYQTGAVSGSSYVGGVVGYNEGTLIEVYFSSRLTGLSHIGGVVGHDLGVVESAYYETTIISYHEHTESEKPTKAIGNKDNTETVLGLDKEYMKGTGILGTSSDQLHFSTLNWREQQTSGLYDFYPQLKGFKENIKSEIQLASSISARTIRFASGSGSKSHPYIIRDANDMLSISEIAKQDNLYSIYFKVADDVTYIDLSDASLNFQAIGASRTRPFRGGFDGNNARFNLNLTTNSNYQGLFGYLMEGADIRNVEIVGFVKGYSFVGAIAGYAEYAIIENVRNYAEVTAYNYAGGLVGQSKFNNIQNVYNFNSVKTTQHYVGGLLGYSDNTNVSFAYNYGEISGNAYVGGLIGSADTKTNIKYVYNRNSVLGLGNYVGGITGYLNGGTLEQAYSAGIVRGGDVSYLGGLIGRVNGITFEDSSYYDKIMVEADDKATNKKPTRAIGNKLDQETVKPVLKTNLTGLSSLSLDSSKWQFRANDGVNAFYPELIVFSESDNDFIKNDSKTSVKSYLFAGEGLVDSPYMITSEYDMKLLASLVNEGMPFTDTYFRVRKDAYVLNMALTGLNYTPIGTNTNPFDGIFDGLGTEFVLDLKGSQYQGLFGYLGEHAVVKNLSVAGTIDSKSYVGSIAGYNLGEVSNVYSKANIKGESYTGGLVGHNEGILKEAYMIGLVEGQNYTGGLVGYNKGSIDEVYAVNQVYGTTNLGGITGHQANEGTTSSAYYNKSIVEIFNKDGLNKPIQAIGNIGDTTSVFGIEIERMTSGILSSDSHAMNLDPNVFASLKPFGFNLYYPQLKYFQTHQSQVIKDASLASVTIDRFTEGDGSQSNPYVIRTAADMKGISDLVGAKNTLKDKYFIVSDDVDEIDLTDPVVGFLPIGNGSYFFQGNFDGNGTTFILNVSNPAYYQGLFGYIGASGVVKNLGVQGTVYGTRFAGGVAGRNDGTIQNTYNMANITANNYYAGGIAGYNSGTISYSFNTGHIKTNTDHYAGGITGAMARNASISYAYNTGLVEVYGSYAGGIVGYSDGNVTQTYNAGLVRGNASGAISGRNTSYATTFSSFYDKSIGVFSNLTKLATRGIANIEDNDFVYGVSTSKLASDDISGINLEFPSFELRLSDGYTGYYPQLSVFTESKKSNVKADSLLSVSTKIFNGEGTENSPYYILDAYDLKALSTLVYQGVSTTDVYFKVYTKNALIDLEVIKGTFRPIGTEANPFNGIFIGNEASINMSLSNNLDLQGLFGFTGENSHISNLTLTGSVKAHDFVGSLVGHNLGHIENVTSFANVEGNITVGGIVGYHDGMMIDTAHKANVKGHQVVGGLVGENNREIQTSYHMGDVLASHDMSGGLIGVQTTGASIYQSFNHGNMKSSGNYTGGLVGYNYGSIELSYFTGDILSDGSYAAGITSVNEGLVRDSYAAGKFYAKGNVSGVFIENKGLSEHAYYDLTIINDSRSLVGYNKPSSAIHGTNDDLMTKGLLHEDMTGYYSIGTYDFQMKFNGDMWVEKEGYDFITYFNELSVFNLHPKNQFKEDSLLSVTSRKIDGDGTQMSPYLIYDANDMLELKNYVEQEYTFSGKYFKVADGIKSIDLTELDEPFTPIGTSQFQFAGTFDGQGANFVVNFNHPIEEYIGLFHTLAQTAVVRNLDISGSVRGQSYVGAVAGRNLGKIENVKNYANITSVVGNDIGGITGLNEGNIVSSTNFGAVSMQGTYAGGITGQNTGSIVHSYNKGQVTGITSIGGIVGRNLSTVEYTYNMALVSGTNLIGGITGDNSGSLSNSFNNGDILATENAVGGIAGSMNNGQIYSVYNTGNIRTPGRIAGGIVGHLSKGNVYDTYHGGSVDALSDLGTIIGQNLGGTVSRSYYDMTNLSVYTPIYTKPVRAIGNVVDTVNVKGLHRAQMAGMNSMGSSITQMNFSNINAFITTGSVDEWSFYPQIKGFANSKEVYVKDDSLTSVQVKTFILGSGTVADPYIIQNESDMVALAETTNSGNDYSGIYFKVKDGLFNLDFKSEGLSYKYVAIGDEDHPFNGSFDGNGVNIDIKLIENKDYQGLFGYVGADGHIKNVSVSGIIQANNYTAGIAGYNEGLIENVYNQANIKGKDYTAGLIGYHEGILMNAYNRGEVYGLSYVGGLVGYSDSKIKYTYNTGVIYGKSNVGALVGFLNKELIENSYYDTRILGAYRSYDTWVKPMSAVSNSIDSDTVKGLDKNFMTGFEAIGLGTFNMDFTESSSNWTTSANVTDQSHYPQLSVFSSSSGKVVRDLSKESTKTTLHVISYDYRGATENNQTLASYAIKGYHYSTPVGFKFGYELAGWYFTNDILEPIQMTNELGESIKPYELDTNMSLYAVWEVANHTVKYVDGNGKVIHEEVVTHGDYITEIDLIPEKNPNRTSVFFFDGWNYDYTNRVVSDLTITANYIEKDRYYRVTYVNGDGDFFAESRIEYGSLAEKITDIPRKTYVGDIAYKFEGWDFDFSTEITENITITPNFSEVNRYYQVRFFDGNGNVYNVQTVEYLGHAILPQTKPVKDPSDSHTYQFVSWENNYRNITKHEDVYPIFNEKIKTFTVTFMDGNGAIFSKQTVSYGESAAEPVGRPLKNSHEEVAYKFIGWNMNYESVTEDMIVLAEFEAIDRYYDVIFYDANDEIIQRATVEYLNGATAPEVIPTKEPSVEHVYTFDGWDTDFSEVQSDLHIRPVFQESLRPYTVTFVDGNGDEFEIQTVLYGENAMMPSLIPSKQAHDEIAYKFVSWSDFKNITADRTVTSSYTPVARYYIITFYSFDSSTVLSSQKIEYGRSAVAPVAPIREHTAINYEYVFTGWNETFDFVESNKNVYPVYVSQLKEFEVTFIAGDETMTQMVKYGANAIAPTPYKSPEDQMSYVFRSWDTVFTNVKEDLVVTAIFDIVYNYYVVEFYNGDQTLLDIQHVIPGMSASSPLQMPFKEKTDTLVYIFTSWDKSFEDVDQDLKVYSIFSAVDRFYEVYFYDANNAVYSTQTVEYGMDAVEPAAPTKPMSEEFIYSFNSWDKDFTSVTSELHIYPIYHETVRTFEVKFYDGNDELIKTDIVEYGKSAIAPQSASKTHTEEIYYIFSGWNKSFTVVKSNLDVYATFNEVDRYYTVNFLDENDEVLDSQRVEYMTSAEDPTRNIPVRVIDENKVFAIVGWDKDFSKVTSNMKTYAIYEEVDRYYVVRYFDDNGGLIKETNAEYGSSVVAPIDQEKVHPNPSYHYIFMGWTEDSSFVTSDLNIYPVFESEIRTFTVTFINGDETTSQVVNYNQQAIAPIPFKTNTPQITYTFDKWDKEFNNVKENIIVRALFNESYAFYVVRFYGLDDELISTQEIEYLKSAVNPIKDMPFTVVDETTIYAISGWDKDFTSIDHDLDVYAVYETIDRYHEVKFYDDFNNVIHAEMVEYGKTPTAPVAPIKSSTESHTYEFMYWSEDFSYVYKALDIYPLYEAVLREFTVTFIDGDDNIIKIETVGYSLSATAPLEAYKTPSESIYYVFSGWDQAYDDITSDLVVKATYTEAPLYYLVRFFGIDNELLDSQTVAYGKDAINPIPNLPFTIIDEDSIFTIIGFDRSLSNVKENRDIYAIYDTIDRYYEVNFYHEDGTLLSKQTVEYGMSATRPEDPIKEEDEAYVYGFIGWDKSFDFVRSDLNIYALFEQTNQKFNVTFYDGDGKAFSKQVIYYGDAAETPEGIPYKSPTPSSVFVFTGWKESYDFITSHQQVYPIYDEFVRTFVVRFIDQNGQLIKEETVKYNESATEPTNYQTPASTDEYMYVPYWSHSFTNVKENLSVKLAFEQVRRMYTYTFLNEDGTVIKTVKAEYGSYITAPTPPEKPMTVKYRYEFVEWGPDYNEVLTKDVTYSPYYDELIRHYEVKFIDGNGEVFESIYVPYGGNGYLPEGIPVKDSTKQYWYEFTMWQVEPISVKRDMEIIALFNRYLNQYKVTFIDENGNILRVQMVEYGTGATEPTEDLIPKKADTREYTYTFAGWSRPFGNITEDIIVQTVYIGALRTYTYTFYDDDQMTIIKQVRDVYGAKITAPSAPTKPNTDYIVYEFSGWDKVVPESLTDHITFYAVYKETGRSYNVIFYNGNNQILEIQKVTYGQSAQTPSETPTKLSSQMYDYVFTGWIEDYSEITDNLSVYPTFEAKLRTFNVTFVNFDGSEKVIKVEYGKSAQGKVATPYRPGYRFVNWDKDINVITSDLLTHAVYVANDYYVNFHGLDADLGEMEPIIAPYHGTVSIPQNSFSRLGYYFAGWKVDESDEYPIYSEQDTFTLTDEGLDLYAAWVPIVYDIEYELDGGIAVNPTNYTIEDTIELQGAQKEEHKFLGWYIKDIILSDEEKELIDLIEDLTTDFEKIEKIESGHIGNLILIALYEYNGYIKLKEESMLGLYHADIHTTVPIYEREAYDDENPVYLLGVFLGQTIGNIKENFINPNVEFIDVEGNPLSEDQVVATGYQMVIRDAEDNTIIRDRVHIVLKGDTNGDSLINIYDILFITNHISNDTLLQGSALLAGLVDETDGVNIYDFLAITNHITGQELIHDPNQTSTMRE